MRHEKLEVERSGRRMSQENKRRGRAYGSCTSMGNLMKLVVKKAAEADVYRDIARIPELHRKDRRGRTIPEGSVCKLSTSGKSAFVLLRGKGDSDDAAIWLDERSRNRLGITDREEADVQVEPVGLWGQVCWGWNASDPSYRVAARLSVLSVVLGLVGLILGVLSFVKG